MVNQIERLINFGLQKKLIKQSDTIFIRNSYLGLLNIKEPSKTQYLEENLDYATDILENILDLCVKENLIEDTIIERDLFSAKIMGVLIDRPSNVNANFYSIYKKSKVDASDYFYKLSQHSNYIQMNRVNKNLYWQSPTKYGNLEISINLSKPEKDPKDIEKRNICPKQITQLAFYVKKMKVISVI